MEVILGEGKGIIWFTASSLSLKETIARTQRGNQDEAEIVGNIIKEYCLPA